MPNMWEAVFTIERDNSVGGDEKWVANASGPYLLSQSMESRWLEVSMSVPSSVALNRLGPPWDSDPNEFDNSRGFEAAIVLLLHRLQATTNSFVSIWPHFMQAFSVGRLANELLLSPLPSLPEVWPPILDRLLEVDHSFEIVDPPLGAADTAPVPASFAFDLPLGDGATARTGLFVADNYWFLRSETEKGDALVPYELESVLSIDGLHRTCWSRVAFDWD